MFIGEQGLHLKVNLFFKFMPGTIDLKRGKAMQSGRIRLRSILMTIMSFLLVWCGPGLVNAQDFAVVSIDLNDGVSDVYCFNFTLSYPTAKISGVHVLADEDPDAFLGGENPFEGCTDCEFPKLDLAVNESVVGPTVWRCDIDGSGEVDIGDVYYLFLHTLMYDLPYEITIANARPQPVIMTDGEGNPLPPSDLDIGDVYFLFLDTLAYPNMVHVPKSPIVLGRDMGDRVNVIFSGWVPFDGPGTVMVVTFNVIPGETPVVGDFTVDDYNVSIVDPDGCAQVPPVDCGVDIVGASLSVSGLELK